MFVTRSDSTTFHQAMAGPEPGAAPAGTGASDPVTILIVDDDPGVRRFAARVLQRAGYRVLISGTAHEAETIAAQERDQITLVLSDVALADTDGRELVQRLQRAVPALRTLLMSGYGRLLPGGEFNTKVLAKPFDATGLLHAVTGALG